MTDKKSNDTIAVIVVLLVILLGGGFLWAMICAGGSIANESRTVYDVTVYSKTGKTLQTFEIIGRVTSHKGHGWGRNASGDLVEWQGDFVAMPRKAGQ